MRFLAAHSLFSGKEFLPSGSVLVLDDQNQFVESVAEDQVDKNRIERFDGVITPGFVNAHCHLELSHLKSKIARGTGLPEFARQVVTQRNQFTTREITEYCLQADSEMWNSGIVAVGDISNTEDSIPTKVKSNIFYHSFIELIGLKPNMSVPIFEKGRLLLEKFKQQGCSASLAPHAPYSTSFELIKSIAEYDREQLVPFTIHNQESLEETKFFQGQANGFNGLYKFLNLDISWFVAPKVSSLSYFKDALTNVNTLLVHNTFSSPADVQIGNEKQVFWCFCPGANQYIENSVPDFKLFENTLSQICLGTDSLASNSKLDLMQEINLLLDAGNVFKPEQLLCTLTYNGAKALGITNAFGGFIKGKNAGLNLVELAPSSIKFIKKII